MDQTHYPTICCLQEIHSKYKDTYRLKVLEWRKIYHANTNQSKAGVVILMSDRADFKVESYQGTSLVVQWLRVRLPMQGTRVQSLVLEDPTCHGATKSMCHNYWACCLEPASHNYWACTSQLLKPCALEPILRNKRSCRSESPHTTTKSSPHLPY